MDCPWQEKLGQYTIINEPLSPGIGLLLEECLLNYISQSNKLVILVWRSRPSIVIGRNLPECVEVNCRIAKMLGIPICRRKSGGGAVYHDEGNINITLIEYTKHRIPVTEVYNRGLSIIKLIIKRLGLNPSIENTSDTVIEGYKVSGSSAIIQKDRYLFHGTLLVDTDISLMKKLLIPRLDLVVSKRVSLSKYNPKNLSSLLPYLSIETVLELINEILSSYLVRNEFLISSICTIGDIAKSIPCVPELVRIHYLTMNKVY